MQEDIRYISLPCDSSEETLHPIDSQRGVNGHYVERYVLLEMYQYICQGVEMKYYIPLSITMKNVIVLVVRAGNIRSQVTAKLVF